MNIENEKEYNLNDFNKDFEDFIDKHYKQKSYEEKYVISRDDFIYLKRNKLLFSFYAQKIIDFENRIMLLEKEND